MFFFTAHLLLSCKTEGGQAEQRETLNVDLDFNNTLRYFNSQVLSAGEGCKLDNVSLNQNKNQITNIDICPVFKNDDSGQVIQRYVLVMEEGRYDNYSIMVNSATWGFIYDNSIENVPSYIENQIQRYFDIPIQSSSKEDNIVSVIKTPIKYHDLKEIINNLKQGKYPALRGEEGLLIYLDPRTKKFLAEEDFVEQWREPNHEVKITLPVGSTEINEDNAIKIYNLYGNPKGIVSPQAVSYSESILTISGTDFQQNGLTNGDYNLFVEIANQGVVQQKLYIGKLVMGATYIDDNFIITCEEGQYYDTTEETCKLY